MTYLLALLMAVSTAAQAQNKPWTDTEKQLFVAHTALAIADWSQTRYIAKHPETYSEQNILIGKHPSVDKVDLLFASSIIGSYYIFDSMDHNRQTWLITATIVRGVIVGNNLKIGLRIGF